MALTKGIPASDIDQKCASIMRQYVTAQLVEAATKPEAQIIICDMLDCRRPNKDKWIRCDVCGRWLHFKCINLKTAPAGEFACLVCDAQYE